MPRVRLLPSPWRVPGFSAAAMNYGAFWGSVEWPKFVTVGTTV